MRFVLGSIIIGLLASPTLAAPLPEPKLALDFWDAAYVQGARAGYVHTFVHEFERYQAKLLRATQELRLAVKRSGQAVQLGMDSGTFESADGKVVGVFLKHFLGQSKTLEITGMVDGPWLRLTLDKTKTIDPAPWNANVVGLSRQQNLLRERKLKPGGQFSYLSFEPSINLVVSTMVTAKDYENVELFGGKERRRLLRVESRPERIQGVQLPTLVSWVGDDFTPLRSEADIPPFGRVTLYRTSKAKALSTEAAGKLTDIGTNQFVRLAKRIAKPYDTAAALYRITIRDEENPSAVFHQDTRQRVRSVRGDTIELQITVGARSNDNAAVPTAEYAQSSYFINSDDARVKALAKQAIREERDPWRQALAIEQWVHRHMTVASDQALAPADHVARTLRGDCTEFAMLTAAMCRAAGVPSRTAVGLIYADLRTGPVFAFHMWTEVWIKGSWVPLDATLGMGYVGATHLKIRDQSWHDTYDQAPLLPVFNVLGRLSIEVVRATPK